MALLAAASGCGTTKARAIDGAGMYVAKSGALAIGKVNVVAVPENEDSAIIKYAEDTAFLAPSIKTHSIDIFLTGTNSTENATGIVEAICQAFVSVAPGAAATPATSATPGTPTDCTD